jgi:hypothetical protein
LAGNERHRGREAALPPSTQRLRRRALRRAAGALDLDVSGEEEERRLRKAWVGNLVSVASQGKSGI